LIEAKLGPVSLKRRIAALGGRLEITSDGTGARVEVELPLPPTGGRDADPRRPR
jgi:signal transduction histidine kinase